MVLGCGCGVELVVCVSVVRVWLCFWVFGCFLVQFLGGLLAVREPAGCVHACSKWQTSVSPLEKGGEGTGVGGFCQQKAPSVRRTRVAGVYPYHKPRRRSHFSNTLKGGYERCAGAFRTPLDFFVIDWV